MPTKLVRDGTRLKRTIPLRYATDLLGTPPQFSRATANGSRTIIDGKTDRNRWSGVGVEANQSRGGLYLSTHLDALTNEMMYHGRRQGEIVSLSDILAGTYRGEPLPQEERLQLQKVVVNLTAQTHIAVADLSGDSEAAKTFYSELSAKLEVKKAISGIYKSSLDAVNASDDHSASRAIALALKENPYIEGIQIGSVRRDYPSIGDTNDNVVLFGPDNKPLKTLRADSTTLYYLDDAGQLQSIAIPVEK